MHDDTPAFTAPDGRLDGWQLVQLRQLADEAGRVVADVERHLAAADLGTDGSIACLAAARGEQDHSA
jgi:hypothetical protein